MQLALIGVAERGRLREALDWLMRHGIDGCAASTVQQHSDHRRWLLEWFGDCPLADVTYERLCEYRDKEGPKGRGVMIVTVRKRLITLRMALKEARRRNVIREVPEWPKLKSDSRPGERVISVADFNRMRSHVALEPWRVWLDLAFYTGQRRSDVDSMRWHMVNFAENQFLRRSTKTKARPEWFPLHPELRASLTYQFERRAPRPTDYIAGKWVKAVRDMAKACLSAKVDRVSPNDLRRSCESHLLGAGASPEFTRQMLCHSESIANRHYRRATPELLNAGAEAMRKVGCG